MQTVLNNRLYYLAETRDWICTEQAKIKKNNKNRSCEDQILLLTHSISGRYQATKPKKTVLALLDYHKAFHRVWREDLLIRAIEEGLPNACAQWFLDYLPNRKVTVQIKRDRG